VARKGLILSSTGEQNTEVLSHGMGNLHMIFSGTVWNPLRSYDILVLVFKNLFPDMIRIAIHY